MSDPNPEPNTPVTATNWIFPRLAFGVVLAAAIVIVAILGLALRELSGTGTTADPDAGTIAALASAAFTALSSLVAAYFGIKAASEQSAQSAATSRGAVRALANSTPNTGQNGESLIDLNFS